jgi:putative flippase GtrA
MSLLRYLLVGVLNTCVGLGTIYLCMYVFHLGNAPANAIGYAVGIVVSFTMNRRWTFADRGHPGPQLLRFLLVTAVAYLANLGTVMGLIHLGVPDYLAQALGVAPYTAIGYAGSRWFVFRSARTA